MTELIDGTIDVARARPARVEDLLRRPPPTEHSPEARRLLTGSTVIVTGAAGQVGSELVRQLLVLQPKRIVMVDRAENTMRAIAHDLDSTIQVVQGSTSITTHPLDVTDELAVTRLMRQTDPDVVFHAAAETHDTTPGEHATRATRVNIGGTRAVVDASIDCGVERFVLVSTEEAAGQSSVAGGTMRVAEMVVSDAARRTGRAFASVRLCNGLRSNGSVVPVLESRLDDGQPLTISDPGETVYPMGIPETSWLVLEAAASSEGAGLFVLDMGAPVRITDVAGDLIRLRGGDITRAQAELMGPRPGRGLHEARQRAIQDATPTDVPGVFRMTTIAETPVTISSDVSTLMELAEAGRSGPLRTRLLENARTSVHAEGSSPDRTDDQGGRAPSGGSTECLGRARGC